MDKCNGWVNYPTWAMFNWITNDENTYKSYINFAHELYNDYDGNLVSVQDTLSGMLRESVEFQNPLIEESSLYSDILEWSIGVIDYYSIICALLEGEEW